jgi:hypothetical protein
MATDVPSTPYITFVEETRTLESVELLFTKPDTDGGSRITGYQLWRDEGILGSPFEMIFDGTDRPELLLFNATSLVTSFTYTFKLYTMNTIFESEEWAEVEILIGLAPSKPYQPEYLYEEYTSGSITIGWYAPDTENGWPILTYQIWVDDGAGNWPVTPIDALAGSFDSLDYLIYEMTSLTDSETYGFKIQATNAIGISIESNSQYFACATVPSASTEAPILEAATDSSITVSWNAPSEDGGSPITGYKLYINPLDDGDWYLIYNG